MVRWSCHLRLRSLRFSSLNDCSGVFIDNNPTLSDGHELQSAGVELVNVREENCSPRTQNILCDNADAETVEMSAATPPQFPTHNQPRVWLITSASSPIGIAVSRELLNHGDFLIAGVKPTELLADNGERGSDLHNFREEIVTEGWNDRCSVVGLDERCEVSSMHARRTTGLTEI